MWGAIYNKKTYNILHLFTAKIKSFVLMSRISLTLETEKMEEKSGTKKWTDLKNLCYRGSLINTSVMVRCNIQSMYLILKIKRKLQPTITSTRNFEIMLASQYSILSDYSSLNSVCRKS